MGNALPPHGLIGLCRKEYAGKGKRPLSGELQQAIEGLALQKPALSVATMHRKIVAIVVIKLSIPE